MTAFERRSGDGYVVSTDRDLLDLDAIHAVLRGVVLERRASRAR